MNTTDCRRRFLMIILLLAFITLPATVWAQTPTPNVQSMGQSAITQTPETVRPERELPEREDIPGLDEASKTPAVTPGEETIHIRDFKLEGVEFLDESELQSLLEPYRNRDLTIAQIEEAAARITQVYQERGYILTRAYIPRQDARDGVLTINILAGRYGDITIENYSLVDNDFLKNMFSRFKTGEIAMGSDLERKLLLVGDLPGASMPSMAVGPGKTHGTADLGVTVPNGDRFNGYLTLDNQGSRYTGRWRLGAGLDINSLFGAGDRLTFNGVGTDELGDGLLNGRFAFSTPLGYDGLRAELAVERTAYELNKEYRELDAVGYTDAIKGTLSYPIIRSRNQNLWLNVQGAYKHIKDEIKEFDEVLHKHSWVGSGFVQYERWTKVFGEYRLYTSAGLGFTYGHLRIGDKQQRASNKRGADTIGDFSYVSFNFMANYAFTQKFSFNLIFNAQQVFNRKNLDGSEQFIISGPGGVRAYRETLSGDNGYFLNGEFRYQLPEVVENWRHSVGLFGGIGRSYYADGDYVVSNGDTIYDVGVGYYVNYDPIFAKIQLAHMVGPRPDGIYTGGRTHVLANIGITF